MAKAAIVAAKAVVEAAKAVVATATLNLGFTTILSPIDGIAAIATAQVGDLVGPNSGTLTTVSTLDPIKEVYFTASEQAYLNFVRRNPTPAEQLAAQKRLELELVLADGTTYPHKGTFYIADREVNVQTGSIRLAGCSPDPGNVLRPGQYGRVRAVTRRQGALLVPRSAPSRSSKAAIRSPSWTVRTRSTSGPSRSASAWARCGSSMRDCTRVNVWSSRGCRRCVQAWWCTRRRLSQSPGRRSQLMSNFFINRPIVAMVIAIPPSSVVSSRCGACPWRSFLRCAAADHRLDDVYRRRCRHH